MNLFQLILKQMRQRLLSTCLTCLSITLGMTLIISISIVAREGKGVFAQTDYGFDLLVGPKASPLQLVLNTIYHIDVSPGNVPYRLYEDMATGRELSEDGKKNPYRGLVAWAVPYAVGDSYKGRRIVGTTPQLFGVDDAGQRLPEDRVPKYRRKEAYTFAEGRAFAPNKFEAVIGSEVAEHAGLAIGSTFHATHGMPDASVANPDVHEETWTVVGILQETHTANDRVLFIPLMSFYAIFEHEEGLEKAAAIQGEATTKPAATTHEGHDEKAYAMNADGTFEVKLPKAQWEVSAILVQTRSPAANFQMAYVLRNLPEAVGVNPATTMRTFFETFVPLTKTLFLLVSVLVVVVAAVSILVSIYNSVSARYREIAIMRALGATRGRILAIVCLEAGLVGLIGSVLGIALGHVLAAGGSVYLERMLGTGIPWWRFGIEELAVLPAMVAGALLAGLVPAMKAYQVPVAENLAGGT